MRKVVPVFVQKHKQEAKVGEMHRSFRTKAMNKYKPKGREMTVFRKLSFLLEGYFI